MFGRLWEPKRRMEKSRERGTRNRWQLRAHSSKKKIGLPTSSSKSIVIDKKGNSTRETCPIEKKDRKISGSPMDALSESEITHRAGKTSDGCRRGQSRWIRQRRRRGEEEGCNTIASLRILDCIQFWYVFPGPVARIKRSEKLSKYSTRLDNKRLPG